MKKQKLLALFFFIFVFALSYRTIEDIDLGWHLRVGQFIAENKSVPTHDLFTFSQPNYPYIYHSWASELLLFEAFNALGLPGVSIVYAAILTITIITIYKTSKIIAIDKISYTSLTILTLISYTVAGGRTRVFSLLFLSLTYYCFVKFYYLNSKIVWAAPVIILLWTNFHGSFPLGIGTLAITSLIYYFLSGKTRRDKDKLKTLTLITVISTLATLINPYFLNSWQNAFKIFINSYAKIASVNPDWQSLAKNPILIVLFSALILFSFFDKQKVAKVHIALSALFLLLSLLTSRFLVGLVVFAAPLANLTFLQMSRRLDKNILNSPPVRFSIAAAVLVIALSATANIVQAAIAYKSNDSYAQFLSSKSKTQLYPSWSLSADNFLDINLKNARILNESNWGGLMLLHAPSRKIFYYSAMDNYIVNGKSFAFEYLSIANAQPGWEQKIENYQINTIYLPPYFPLVKKLRNNNSWQTVYRDDQTVIITKN